MTDYLKPGAYGTPDHLHGVPVTQTIRGAPQAGPVFCPIYFIEGTNEKVLIDDPAFVSAVSDMEAAKIAIMRQVDTALSGLVWSRKIGVVTLKGILSRKGRVGPMDVLFIAGPTFDLGRRNDDQVVAARRAAGLPTGDPGSRKIKVVHRSELI